MVPFPQSGGQPQRHVHQLLVTEDDDGTRRIDRCVDHVGDLGNFKTDGQGNATGSVTDKLVKLIGPESVLGRTIVVHAGTDDLGQGGNEESARRTLQFV